MNSGNVFRLKITNKDFFLKKGEFIVFICEVLNDLLYRIYI